MMITPVIGTLIAALIAAIVGLVTVWIKDKRDYQSLIFTANDKLIDQLQEERGEIKDKLSRVAMKVDGLLLQGRYKDDYINALRSHIEQGNPPPPPNYPPELLRIGIEGL
jgi:peptidoglycan hydrolase CwlO-like protein